VELVREKQVLPNVVGWIHPPTGPAGEAVVVGTSLGGSSEAPGKFLELARVLQGERPRLRRSILFAAFADGPSGGRGASALLENFKAAKLTCLVNLAARAERGSEKVTVQFAGAKTGEGIAEMAGHLGKEARPSSPDSYLGPEAAFWAREVPALRASFLSPEGIGVTARLVAALASDPGVPGFAEPEDFLLGPPGEAVSSRGILVDPAPVPGMGSLCVRDCPYGC